MIAIDTNLLVYAHRSGVPEHAAARGAIARAAASPAGWGIPLACVAEFWSVVTHPAAAGRPSRPAEARAFLERLLTDGGGEIWLPLAGHERRLLALAEELAVAGPRVFDIGIGLVAFENGATEIWTHDAGFRAIPGLAVHDPLLPSPRA